MRPYHSQPTPYNWHLPIDKGELILRMGASTIALKYFMKFDTMFHPLYFRFTKIGIPNYVI